MKKLTNDQLLIPWTYCALYENNVFFHLNVLHYTRPCSNSDWSITDGLQPDVEFAFTREGLFRFTKYPAPNGTLTRLRKKTTKNKWIHYAPTYFESRNLQSGTRFKIFIDENELYMTWFTDDTIVDGIQCSGNIRIQCMGSYWKVSRYEEDEELWPVQTTQVYIMRP